MRGWEMSGVRVGMRDVRVGVSGRVDLSRSV